MKKRNIAERACRYIKGHRRHYFLRGVSAIVVFCTVYSLILPAISMEQRTYCGQTEHQHSEACYESRLICGYAETEAVETLGATAATGETLPGATAESTVPEETQAEAHVHTDACYEQVLTCEKQEHTHSLSCYADPNADVESADVWARSVSGVALSGNWAEDLAAVAASQLGYRESEKNYQVAEDGVTIKGYTRYGDWSGDRYGDWNAMFVSFCLNYANIPASAFPRETNPSRWVRALTQSGLYHASGYEPVKGDLVFFDRDDDGTSDRVGVITGTTQDESDHVTQISTVEGDSANCVQRGSYSIDESTISGFAALPENPNAAVAPVETVPVETTPAETEPVKATDAALTEATLPTEAVRPSAEINAEGDTLELKLNETLNVTVAAGETVKIPFTPAYTHEYVFQSTGSVDTYGYLYDADGKQLTYNDDGAGNRQFKITYTLTAGTLYYFGVKYYSSSSSGTIPVQLTPGTTHTYTETESGGLICGCGQTVRTVSALELDKQTDVTVGEKETVRIPFTPAYTHQYVFAATGSADTNIALYNASGSRITYSSGTNVSNTQNLTGGASYYFEVMSASGAALNISVRLTLGVHQIKDNGAGEYICACGERALTGLELDEQMDVDVAAGKTVMIAFTPTYTHEYVFESTGSGDTFGYLYNSSGTQLASNDNGAGNNQFKITYNLTAGTTYFYGVKYVSATASGTIPVRLTLGVHPIKDNGKGEYVCACGERALTGLELDKQMDVDVATGKTVMIQFTPAYTHEYVLKAADSGGSTSIYVYLYDSNGNQITSNYGLGPEITRTLTAGTTYLLGVRYYYTTASGTIPVQLTLGTTHTFTEMESGEYICVCGERALTGLELNTQMDVDVAAGKTVMIAFTPEYSHQYDFQSLGSGDTCGYLYNSSGTQLTSNDDGAGNKQFKITYTLSAGTTYYYGVKYKSATDSGTIPVRITLGNHSYTEDEAGDLVCSRCGWTQRTVNLELNKPTDITVGEKETIQILFTRPYYHDFTFTATGSADTRIDLSYYGGNWIAGSSGADASITDTMYDQYRDRYYYEVTSNGGVALGTVSLLLKPAGTHVFEEQETGDPVCGCGASIHDFIGLDKEVTVEIPENKTVRIPFTPEFTHEYVLESAHTHPDNSSWRTELLLYDADGKQLASGTLRSDYNSYVTYKLTAGTRYYLGVYCRQSYADMVMPIRITLGKTHEYEKDAAGDMVCACGLTITPRSSLVLDKQTDVALTAGETAMLPFTPRITHEYIFQSTGDAAYHTYLYDADGKLLAEQESAKTYTLQAGATYYYAVRYEDAAASGTIPMLLTLGVHSYNKKYGQEQYCTCGELIKGLEVGKKLNLEIAAGKTVCVSFKSEIDHTYYLKLTGSASMKVSVKGYAGNGMSSSDYYAEFRMEAGKTCTISISFRDSVSAGTVSALLTFYKPHTYRMNDAMEYVCACGKKAEEIGLALNKQKEVRLSSAEAALASFTPAVSHTYVFSCESNYSGRFTITLYDSDGKALQSFKDSAAVSSRSYRLTAGMTYYYTVALASGNSITAHLSLVYAEHQYTENEAGEIACVLCGEKLAASKCGDNLWWSFADGTLTITGTGDMYAFSSSSTNPPPWANVSGQIEHVVIEEGATSIGERAFYDCDALTSVTIPEGVTTIGERAFYDCDALTSISIPEGATSIGIYAFYDCGALTSVTIPDGVTSIGDYAFYNCDALTSVTIPGSVTSMDHAFYDCDKLKSVTIEDGVERIYYAFGNCDSLTAVTIPGTVTSMEYAFYDCNRLKSVTIEDGVPSIGKYAFYSCGALTSIAIPESVTTIDSFAFRDCSSLASVTLPESLTAIGRYAFDSCSSLKSITIPDGVTRIDVCTFSNCSSLASITLPESLTAIEYGAFASCSSLTSLSIPGGVTSIWESALAECEKLGMLYWNAAGPVGITDDDRRVIGTDSVFTTVVGKDADVFTSENVAWLVSIGCNKIEFAHKNYITLSGDGFTFPNESKPVLPEGRYYIDESGVFYRISEGKAYVAYYPAEVENTAIPATIPAEDGGEPLPVVGVDSYAFRQATISELTFEAPENIGKLADFAFFGAENLASINGNGTDTGILAALHNAEAGMLLFTGTKITCGGITDEALTAEKQELKLTISTAPGTYRDPVQAADGTFLYYTGEGAKTTITVSNPESGVADSEDVIRVYFNFDAANGTLDYQPGHYDVVAQSGTKYGMDVFETDVPGCYCLELQRPAQGDTVSLIVTSQYPSPTSGGGFAAIWGGILTAAEKTALGTGVLQSDSFHLLSWDTSPDDFPVTKTGGNSLIIRGDGKGGAVIDGLTYTISMRRADETLEGVGKDFVTAVDFVDTLILPEGVALSEEVAAAIRDKTYEVRLSSDEIYFYLPDSTRFLTLTLPSKGQYQFKEKIMKTINMGINGQGQLVICWAYPNGDLSTEISDLIHKVTIDRNAVVIPHPEAGRTYEITNHVSATQHFMYSEDRIQEDTAVGTVMPVQEA